MCAPDVPGPDPRIGEAALRNAELGQEAFDWYKQYFETTLAPLQQEQASLNKQVTQQQLDIARDNQRISNETYDYQKGTFRPVEQAIAADAMKFNEADYANRKAALAGADVTQAFDQAGAEVNRDLARRGMSLSAGQASASASDLALRKAAAIASASNAARDQAEAVGFARKMDAASIGRNLPSQQATAAQIALSGGSQASGVAGSSLSGAQSNAGVMGQGYNTNIGANQAAGQLYATSSQQAQYAAAQNQQNSGDIFGTLVGAGTRLGSAYMLSSKKVKKDRRPVKESAATLAVEAMPIDRWKYDEDKVPALADGREHIGPMAQDFAKHVGGDGETINLGDAVGVTMAATKDLAKRVKRLEKRA